MVCDEVCPYDAIDFMREPGNPMPVPHVIEDRCAGCGYCEHHCPIQNQAAIVVTPLGALRPPQGSYEVLAKSQGLSLTLKPTDAKPSVVPPETSMAPGFEGAGAPGFEAPAVGGEGAAAPAQTRTRPLAPGFEE
jgi:ferredoxin